jgi:hypothetical protein
MKKMKACVATFLLLLISWLSFSQIPTVRSVGGDGKRIDWSRIKAEEDRLEKTEGGPGFFYFDCDQGVNPLRASSTLKNQGKNNYAIKNVNDWNPMSAWVEGAPDYGIGEYFEIRSAGVNTIYNGYQASPKAWLENSRVKTFKVYKNNIALCYLELTDEMGRQSFELPDHNRNSPDKESVYRFEIVDVFKGTRWPDVAISEINFALCCVAESSSVKTAFDNINFTSVGKGCAISSINITTGELSIDTVLKVFKQRHLSLLKINCGENEIELTYNHPLYIKNVGFSSISRYMERNKINNYTDLINNVELGIWDESNHQIKFEKIKSIDLLHGDFETITIGKLTKGNTFITNGFVSRTY